MLGKIKYQLLSIVGSDNSVISSPNADINAWQIQLYM